MENSKATDGKILMMGSCFSTEIGQRLIAQGRDVTLNPFGILFNPASIASSLQRLESGMPFTMQDVVSRDGQYVSFFHHGSFRRPTPEEFLENANFALEKGAKAFDKADCIILTLGTAWVFRHKERGYVVSNCHKVPSREFSREFLSVEQIEGLLSPIVERHQDKRWIFTVSPIRHMADGLHGNQLSKSTLIVAIDRIQKNHPDSVEYFPSYEIMMDSLRDHSYYIGGGNHPSPEAVDIIARRFGIFFES